MSKKFIVKSTAKDPINAIKASLAKKSGLCVYLQNELNSRDTFVLKKLNDDDKWEYVIQFNIRMSYIGKTTIEEYTNKKGITHLAHFNGSRYEDSVKKLGDKPVNCIKWGVPNKQDWTIREGKFIRM